jgi:hypothetical protein
MNGEHRNPTNNPQYFTTAFFHGPDELRTQVEQSGLSIEKIPALEGPAMWIGVRALNSSVESKAQLTA